MSNGSSPWERGEWPIHGFACEISVAQRGGWLSVLPPTCTCGADMGVPPEITTITTDSVSFYRTSDKTIENPITQLNFAVEWNEASGMYRATCLGHPADYVEAPNPVRALALMIQQIREMEK